jgi:hypothetical protein
VTAKRKAKTDLVQIVGSEIPPHHQSTVEKMNCHVLYGEDQIKRRRQPGGMESARGLQIHRTMSHYAGHCKERKVSMDLEAFEHFRQGAGPHAAKILSGLRDGYQVDFQHLIGTELNFRLDGKYRPTTPLVKLKSYSTIALSTDPTEFEGTLDSLYGFPQEYRMVIEDYKSHPRPFMPDDPDHVMQGIEYAVFVFMHFPWVERITFRLIFVRYRNCTRETDFFRKDLTKYLEALRASRDLQKSIHKKYDAGEILEATPGNHCLYCPLLTPRTCPIAEFNPALQHTMEDRMRFYLWYQQFSKANTKVMNAHIQATGRSIIVKDGNGRPYMYGPKETQSKVYPIFERDLDTGGILYDQQGRPSLPIIEHLMDHAHSDPDDTEWMLKLVISSTKMNSALKANSRVVLDQQLKDDVFVVTKTPMKVTRPSAEEEEEERQFDEEDDEDEDTD